MTCMDQDSCDAEDDREYPWALPSILLIGVTVAVLEAAYIGTFMAVFWPFILYDKLTTPKEPPYTGPRGTRRPLRPIAETAR